MDSVDVTESEPQPEPESNPSNPFGDNDASPVHEVVDKVGILSLDAEIKEELNRKVQYGSSLTITVDDPKEEGGKLNSYVSYCVTVRPALPGVSYVRRRFSDFEWLRDVLTASFPGVFIPPLPPKKLIGKDQEFIKERTHNLERFINRVAAIPFCAATEVFQNFLSRHESSFEGLKKELEKKIKASPSGELLRSYSDLFPHAFNTPLPDDADESMLRLHSFLEKQEAELTPMVKAAEALVQHSEEAVKDAQQIHTFASHLDKLEADYPQRPSPARTNVLPHMERWTQTLKSSTSSFKAHLADSYRYELEDIQAMLEVVKARDELKKAADKAHARAEKWRAPGVVATAKQTQQKDEDMAQEEATRFAVDVVTKVVLLDQLPHVWEEKMGSFRSTIKALARDYLETAKVIASTWENLANLDD